MDLLTELLGLEGDALIERIEALSAEEVDELLPAITERRDELAGQLEEDETHDEALEGLEALGAIKSAAIVRQEALADEADAKAERAAAALAALDDDDDEGDGDGDGDGEGSGDGDGDGAGAGEGDGDEPTEAELAELAARFEVIAAESGAEYAAAVLGWSPPEGGGGGAPAPKGKPVYGSDVNFALGKGNPATNPASNGGQAPAFAGWESARKVKALKAAERLGVASAGDSFANLRELAVGMSDAYNSGDLKDETLKPGGDVIARAQSNLPESVTLSTFNVGGKNTESFGADPEKVDAVVAAAVAFRQEGLAEVASGGICVPFAPTYDIFDCGGTPQMPVEGMLPVVSDGGRGGIKFPLPMDMSAVRPGIGIITCADDEAGYAPDGPTPRKPCIKVPCPTFDEVCVTAISRCLCFGNLNFRTYPEWVERRLRDLDIEYACVKETFFLDGIDAGSTPVPACPNPYGAARSALHDVLQYASGYRKRHKMPRNATLEWLAPDWMVDPLKLDLINDHSMGLGFLDATDAQVASAIASIANVSITWYNDSATGAGQVDWAATPTGKWPTNAVSYLFAPGTFVRIDGGALDIGVFRDKALIETNDFCIFAEEFMQIAKVGCESLRIEHDLCPTGFAAPFPTEALVCK